MGNISSTEPTTIELYIWSSAEFPQEYTIIYKSLINRSRFSIFRLRVKPEKILCRLVDSLCHEHPLRLNAEITAEKDNNGFFKFGAVRVVVDGIPAEHICFRDDQYYTHLGGRSCNYGGVRNVDIFSYTKKLTWEIFHCYNLSFRTRIIHHTYIHCNKVAGLDLDFRGPVRSEEVVYGEPPKSMNDIVEREFEGKEYILFQEEGKGSIRTQASGQGTRLIVNSGGQFRGHGNGSTYNHCNIVMQ